MKTKAANEPQVPEILSTHPSHETRVATIEGYLPEALERRANKGCPVLSNRDIRGVFAVMSDAVERANAAGTRVDWGAVSRRLK
jgi:hypothetical protein